jgi:type I restriction enzyme M protein
MPAKYKDYVLIPSVRQIRLWTSAATSNALIDRAAGGSLLTWYAKGDKEIGDKINKIIGGITDNDSLKGATQRCRLQRRRKTARKWWIG